MLDEFSLNIWDDGYEIAFPQYSRELPTSYRSLSSENFHETLMRELPPHTVRLNAKAAEITASGVTLEDGTSIPAGRVIDCRTFTPTEKLAGGWQVFLGLHIKCDTPHGLTRPTIMDATVDQVAPYGNGAAYRFVYVLPLSEDEVFIEDTYYADAPRMEKEQLWARTQDYAHRNGWRGEVIAHETGILPVVTGGDFAGALNEQRIAGVAMAGTRGGFTHPLTSYTLPFAAENALAIADLLQSQPDVSGEAFAQFCDRRARTHWRSTSFYRMLGRMLFEAAEPDKRVNVFEHFYKLSGGLVERFYAAHSTWPDRLRILSGKPPVSIARAMKALVSRGIRFKLENKA